MKRWPLVILGAAVALGVGVCAVGRTVRLHEQQLRNVDRMRAIDREINAYRDARGTFPLSLDYFPGVPNTDVWGNRVLYKSNGREYLLVSYGADGEPDGTNYARLRALGRHEPCQGVNSDVVFSDRGELRTCGK